MSYLRNGSMGAVEIWINPDYVEQLRRAGIDPLAQHLRILGERIDPLTSPAYLDALFLVEKLRTIGTPEQIAKARAQNEFVDWVFSGKDPAAYLKFKGILPYVPTNIFEQTVVGSPWYIPTTTRGRGVPPVGTRTVPPVGTRTVPPGTLPTEEISPDPEGGTGTTAEIPWAMLALVVGGIWLLTRR